MRGRILNALKGIGVTVGLLAILLGPMFLFKALGAEDGVAIALGMVTTVILVGGLVGWLSPP